MLELREGVTDKLVDLVCRVFPQQPWYNVTYTLPPDPDERLKKMSWCFGIYNNEQCVAALWGNETICLICDPEWKGRFLNRRLLSQFYRFFFSKYKKAKIEDSEYAPLWRRAGFHEENGELVAYREDIKW